MRAGTWVLRAGVVEVVVVLVVRLWGQLAPDPAVLFNGKTRTPLSGWYASEFLAEEISGGRDVYPVIKNSASGVLWSGDRRYLMSTHPVGVVWQKDTGVLWLSSDDIGASRVMEKDEEWVEGQDWDTLLPDVEKIEKG